MALGVFQTGRMRLLSLILQGCCVGVLCSDWAVRVPSAPLCAVASSSVVLPCSYDYPQPYRVLSEMWCRDQSRCITPRYVYHSQGIFPEPASQGRVEYLGKEGTRNCSLRISDLRRSDSGTYVFYFITNHPVEKPPGQPGVTLLVADHSSEVAVSLSPAGDVVEGSSVTLFCCSTAQTPVEGYTWYKTGGYTAGDKRQMMTITNISATDSGNYYCEALTTNRPIHSSALSINVQYAPKNTSVSVNPFGELVMGSSVTLSCSSDANPAVERYTWFQRTGSQASLRGSGQSYSITNISLEDSGQYCCVAMNKHGSQSYTVTMTVGKVNGQSSILWRLVVPVGIPITLTLIIIITVACIRRKTLPASSQQGYSLTETTIQQPLP
ncbi:limbic system-associated membrane protein-like [Salvelinus alpinus]|uniref:B-cell receptor CD22 n=1 Tax=Salvelinus sp. IW2-2015 TaxID=2691554 RepID=UPI000CDFD065|nr:B-cell receptor CD22 [Salvelinus alpinus]